MAEYFGQKRIIALTGELVLIWSIILAGAPEG